MKKQLLPLVLVFSTAIVSAQEKKPLPECTDMKAVLMLIQTATTGGHLLDFKDKETGKDGDHILYSANLELCGQKGELNDDKYETRLVFEFESKRYTEKQIGFTKFGIDLLYILKAVFSKWEYEMKSDNDDDIDSQFFYFYESGKNNLENKNLVNMITHSSGTFKSIKIEFRHAKY